MIRNYGVPTITLFLLLLATELYGESVNQPRWNITMFGDIILAEEGYDLGIGGAMGYQLTHWVELEGEGSLHLYRSYILSGEVVIGKSNVRQSKLSPYVLGGVAFVGLIGEGIDTGGMLGGGIKIQHKEGLIRFDLRLYFLSGYIVNKLSIGLMWTF